MSEDLKPSDILNRQFDLSGVVDEKESSVGHSRDVRGHGFFVGGIGLVLETEKQVCEVFDELQICRLPHTADWLLGIANQRGNMVPIFDLERLFGLESTEVGKENRNYLIYGKKEQAVGMLAAGMPVRVSLEEEEVLTSQPPLPSQLQPFARRCFEKQGKIWVEWDIFGFFEALRERVAA